MRMFFAILAMLHLTLVAGCGRAPTPAVIAPAEPLATLSVNGVIVQVEGCERNVTTGSTAIKLAIGDGSRVVLTIPAVQFADGVEHCAAILSDGDGRLLVALEYEWPVADEDPAWVAVTERTIDDVLRVTSDLIGDAIIQTYEINGRQRTVSFPADARPDDLVRLARIDPALMALSRWEPLVDPASTLNYNRDGEFLVRILIHPAFAELMAAEFKADGLSKQMITPEKLCAIAGAVSMLKCFFGGGWMNFICIASSGISIACIIKGIAGGT